MYNTVLPEGVCLCRDCFERGLDGTCLEVSCEDWRYSTQDFDCQDDRPSQLTAFLLSFFLSSTGAANFYIGRDDLGMAEGAMRGPRGIRKTRDIIFCRWCSVVSAAPDFCRLLHNLLPPLLSRLLHVER